MQRVVLQLCSVKEITFDYKDVSLYLTNAIWNYGKVCVHKPNAAT